MTDQQPPQQQETADAPSASDTIPVSPGNTIREARQRAGVSAADLAAQIRLSRATLEALEADDFDTLAEAVYVRGYYRKCAKVLGLSGDLLIAAYEARARPREPVAPQRVPLAGGTVHTRRGRGPMLVAAALLLLLVIAAAVLLLGRQSMVVEEAAAPVMMAPVPPPVAPAPLVTMPRQIDVPAEEPAAEEAAPEEPAATPAAQLTLTFNENSWVRVEDAEGRVLLAGLSRSGERHTLTGTPPLAVSLGYAPGVTMQYDGRSVDLRPHIRHNNTASLTVPPRP
jgi:cytoskeleton protein RodZ